MDKPRVKPLEWEVITDGRKCSRERAPAFGGEYQIVMLDPGPDEKPHMYFEMGLGAFMFRFELEDDPDWPGDRRPKPFPSIEAAKAAAQADYEARILAALEPVTDAPDWEGFGRDLLESWPVRDVDGAELFDAALRNRLIREIPGGYDPEQHIDADGICPEPGDPWYEYAFRAQGDTQ